MEGRLGWVVRSNRVKMGSQSQLGWGSGWGGQSCGVTVTVMGSRCGLWGEGQDGVKGQVRMVGGSGLWGEGQDDGVRGQVRMVGVRAVG